MICGIGFIQRDSLILKGVKRKCLKHYLPDFRCLLEDEIDLISRPQILMDVFLQGVR